ncbi:penicillin-binding protein [Thiospirochaeta perfilievii]|uniref:peptidoglycan glycosyltransferase n=1 Tax=Thiospirochaeta perfilievii TaxID=252967 RepID=A0A5C1QF30_9SPIO|nr:transglycosylase domain-containing protein [Thiospirochaeta perfilievii]QEN05998.1 penicillin-binding protein [Thiospirochaeta perfilievii]
MIFTHKHRIGFRIFFTLFTLLLIVLSVGLAFAVSININNKNIENFILEKPSLPSVVLDRNGEVISELVGVEQRTLLEFNDLPKYQVFALLTREDNPFFRHNGFSVRGFSRAVFSILKNGNLDGGGGSTLTQQLAKIRLDNVFNRSIFTKLEELWEAWQVERQYSKQEIFQMYLNKVNFGHGAYGIEAISNYFFEHSARENSAAESVMSVIQVARPTLYSPFRNPSGAKKVQRRVLDQMVLNGYISAEDADKSFATYWLNHDWSRDGAENVHSARKRDDKAPWFTEYVREELKNLLYGTQDPYKDGYTIHTSLDLNYQAAADKFVLSRLTKVRDGFKNQSNAKKELVYNQFSPIISLMGLVSNIKDIKVEDKAKQQKEHDYFNKSLSPQIRLLSLISGINSLNSVSQYSLNESKDTLDNQIETALITVDNTNGQILALIGGSKFEYTNQLNRVLNPDVQISPGSAFKPLYMSAGISSNKLTAGTHFTDKPKTFVLDGAEPYTPNNYGGHWYGHVLLRYALNKSLNIPAIESLEKIGFDDAISRSAALLGITDPSVIRRKFDRKFPMALGTTTVSPGQMVRAFATFANQGKANDPYGIKFIENQNGAIITHVEDDMLQKSYRPENQIMSAQDAYIMTSILETTKAPGGTLNYGWRTEEKYGIGFNGMAIAGKTGTSQNWKDSWAVGYSPYYTTSLWYGFDKGSNTLGQNNNGAVLAGFVWAKYMAEIHKDLPVKQFFRPNGIIERTICAVSGDLASQNCPDTIREVYKTGTEPTTFCEYHTFVQEARNETIFKIMDLIEVEISPDQNILNSIKMETDFFENSEPESNSDEDLSIDELWD